ncbi:hypothetical protein BgAZ_402250 [Babesia gibsoni]|uniref:6-Cys domain-containing protein n=1 Tax=Babesia gibsoni TaxID=33632 RepID=A0AAD8LRE3_BABGI|nr:hypothetical protein BgAZ_402250 [Babesia gibsoni]
MASFVWIVPLLLALLSSADEIEWYKLNLDDLNATDNRKRLVMVHGMVINGFSLRLVWPASYILYPPKNEAEPNNPNVYILSNGKLLELPLSRVIQGIYGDPIVNYRREGSTSIMEIHYPGIINPADIAVVNLLRRYAQEIHFVCLSPEQNMSNHIKEMVSSLITNRVYGSFRIIKRMVANFLEKSSSALGIFTLDIDYINVATHGCGSKDTPQFLNEAKHDEGAAFRSCTVDIMEHPQVGFYCDGTIQPDDCFNEIYDSQSYNRVFVGDGVMDIKLSQDNKWHFAEYDRKKINMGFNGYCLCFDSSTGLVNAKITLMTEMSHECDISGLMFQHLTQPILGNWCDIGLLPGSTLTIKLPLNRYHSKIRYLEYGGMEKTNDLVMHSYTYPKDMKEYFLNQDDIVANINQLRLYDTPCNMMGGALKIDQSRRNEGIITMTYMRDIPLTYSDGIGGLSYIWNLKLNETRFNRNDIRAVINVVPAPTHDITLFGCEPATTSIFMFNEEYRHSKRFLNVYGHMVQACYTTFATEQLSALYCPPGQSMEPSECEKFAFNETLTSYDDWTGIAVVSKHSLVSNMTLFNKSVGGAERSFSRTCSCVDSNGVETARLIIDSEKTQRISGNYFGMQGNMKLIVPSVNIVDAKIEGKKLPEIEEILFNDQENWTTWILSPGNNISITCSTRRSQPREQPITLEGRTTPFLIKKKQHLDEESLDLYQYNQWECNDPSKYKARIYPINRGKYFYQHMQDGETHKLVPVEYSKVLGSNATGLNLGATVITGARSDRDTVNLKNPLHSIVVSKNNEKSVKLIYICGRLTKPHRPRSSETVHRRDEGVEVQNDEEPMDVGERRGDLPLDIPSYSGNAAQLVTNEESSNSNVMKETRALTVFTVANIMIPATDPYLRGCGMTDPSEELFREDTVPIHDSNWKKVGCEVDLSRGDASFYCPLPYFTDPEDCLPTPSTGPFRVKKPGEDGNKHFYIFEKVEINRRKKIRLESMKKEPFECHCITKKGAIRSTIRIIG